MTHQVFFKSRANKYHAKRQTYNGFSYHSKKEADYAFYLDHRLKRKEILAWDRQFKVSIMAGDKTICNYYVDFRVHNLDGSYTLVEVKGMETDVWRLKRKLLEYLWLPDHPEYDYIVEKV